MAEGVHLSRDQRHVAALARHRALGHDDDRRVLGLEAACAPGRRPRRCRRAPRGSGRRSRRRTMPACRAIQPAWRPITSTTSTRWCDSAVVCSRSIASLAMLTAVSKPKVKSVPDRSLSIVFGTPTTFTPRSASLVATPRVSSPPIATSASTPSRGEVLLDLLDAAVDLERVGARLEPRMVPPRGRMPRTCAMPSVHGQPLERALPAVAEADELEAVDARRPCAPRPGSPR